VSARAPAEAVYLLVAAPSSALRDPKRAYGL
jgi:hypothetical protein